MDQSDQRGHRPLAFDKMEGLVQEMQDADTGVPVRSQKQFLTSIPSAFTGYDVIEWLMDRLNVDDPVEAVNIANQLCHYGYFFPVSDSKNLVVKDDGSLYRFQIPYYWPCQNRSPDNVEYAIYLAKRSLRNKQKHGLEDYELESLNSLKKNLANKWDFITIQAEEQVRLAKDRKKGEKIVSDSQERAFWRVHRPPPGYSSSLEPLPLRAGGSAGTKKRRNSQDIKKEVEFLKSCVDRTRTKVSVALESLMQFSETYTEYDPVLTSAHPSNPWIADDVTFWQLNSSLVEIPTEKRVRRWALSMEELVADPTGLQEFTNYLRKEYSHENIRFWMAANDLRRSSQPQIARKVKQIYGEFLAPGAPCEINIDGKTMEKTQLEMKTPSRFTFDSAAEHVYTLLLKKDCYPRFIRSEHYKNLSANAVQPTGKKKFDFFGFGGAQGKAKPPASTKLSSTCGGLQTQPNHPSTSGTTISISRRRGSDRSLSGSTHELSVPNKVIHSHSQSNITEIAGRELNEVLEKSGDEVCPWDFPEPSERHRLQPSPSIAEDSLATEHGPLSASRKNSTFFDSSSSSDISTSVVAEVTERLRKSCGLHETISRFSRRSSSAANSKQADSTRPSVSSTEDLTTTPFRSFDSNPPGTSSDKEIAPVEESAPPAPTSRRKSITALISRKQSGSNTTPLISVSSVSEHSEQEQNAGDSETAEPESSSSKQKSTKKPSSSKSSSTLKKAESMEVKVEKSDLVTTASTSRDIKTENEKEKSNTASTPNEVCPWEDEENCKVKASNYMKFYETLGYL